VRIQLPLNYSDDKKYSVVYMTDSPYTFPITTGAARFPINFKRMENAMFVGISWQKGYSAALSRQRDYTPTRSSPGFKDPSGEAGKHLAFIRDVIPYIEQRFSTETDPTQ
jgi:predicted alpha/beta superfamily hydrolase